MTTGNKFDNLQLNAATVHQRQPISSTYSDTARSGDNLSGINILGRIAARYWTAFAFKSGLLRRLMYANLKLNWFYEFQQYWVNELGMRKIDLHDWHFLHGIYRQKFQSLEVPNSADSKDFLLAWQQPETIYLLFAYQYKLAMRPLSAWPLARHIPNGAKVCEYGCGLAPITQSLIRYYPEKRIHVTAADIPTFMLHFLRWKFRTTPFVRILSIDPANDTPLTDTYDVIMCLTVLEHLPRPLSIMKHLHRQLRSDGIFIFDYIQSSATGLDTEAGLRDRQNVLAFIRRHFRILAGTIPATGSISQPVVCQKSGD